MLECFDWTTLGCYVDAGWRNRFKHASEPQVHMNGPRPKTSSMVVRCSFTSPCSCHRHGIPLYPWFCLSSMARKNTPSTPKVAWLAFGRYSSSSSRCGLVMSSKIWSYTWRRSWILGSRPSCSKPKISETRSLTVQCT